MKYLTHWATALITLAVLVFFHYSSNTVVETVRLNSLTYYNKLINPIVSKDIGIVTIDEKSIEAYGQWSWNREVLADIIWKLPETVLV